MEDEINQRAFELEGNDEGVRRVGGYAGLVTKLSETCGVVDQRVRGEVALAVVGKERRAFMVLCRPK